MEGAAPVSGAAMIAPNAAFLDGTSIGHPVMPPELPIPFVRLKHSSDSWHAADYTEPAVFRGAGTHCNGWR